MTKVNPNNGNETKPGVFPSEDKQVQRNKITQDMCKSDSIFLYLQSSILFK